VGAGQWGIALPTRTRVDCPGIALVYQDNKGKVSPRANSRLAGLPQTTRPQSCQSVVGTWAHLALVVLVVNVDARLEQLGCSVRRGRVASRRSRPVVERALALVVGDLEVDALLDRLLDRLYYHGR
jgi:hypothetical protein